MPSRKPDPVSTPTTLRESLYELIHRSPMPAKQQAEELQVSYSYLCNAANPNLDVCEYPLRLLVPHVRLTGNLAVLDFLEWSVGRVAVDLPQIRTSVPPATIENLPTYICRVMKEIGDVVRVHDDRCGDHDLSDQDKARIGKEVRDVIQKATQIVVALGAA